MRTFSLTAALAALTLAAGFTATANAQIGSGWTSTSFSKSIHLDSSSGLKTFSWTSSKSVDSPPSADYQYTSSTKTERFRIIDNRSNRSEIRLHNEYSSGHKQFQGYVKFSAPLNDESLFQIFGSTSGATLTMMRGYSSSGGSIRTVGGGGTIATSCYGKELRINVIHNQNQNVQFYVNGSKKADFSENENVTNYWKYGCYGTLTTGTATVYWRDVRTFTK